jgi:hypothetical protein
MGMGVFAPVYRRRRWQPELAGTTGTTILHRSGAGNLLNGASSQSMEERKSQTQYTAVFRCAESMIRVPPAQAIGINPLHTDVGDFRLTILTRTDTVEGFESPLPRELCIEVIGPSADLQTALTISTAIANDFARQFAFLANAWQGVVNLHLAFDSAAGERDREFVQSWIADEGGVPRIARVVHPELMARAITALSGADEKDIARILRAIRQYTDALRYWRTGQELYALSCLWMGVEAITKPIALREVAWRGLKDRTELPKTENDKYPEAWVRRVIIFKGDDETYQLARSASDGLEHGFASLAEAHEKAIKSMEKTAQYLRQTILSLLPLSDDDRKALLEKPYAKPASTAGVERMIFGTILSDEHGIAASGQDYPYVRWAYQLQDFAITADGGHKMKLTQNLTPLIGTAAKFSPKGVRWAAPTETTHSQVEVKASGLPTPENPVSPSGIVLGLDEPDAAKWTQSVGSLILNINILTALARFWLQKLTGAAIDAVEQKSFEATIEDIRAVLVHATVAEDLRSKVDDAWAEALSLDEVRRELACARTQPEGLVLEGRRRKGQAPLITDVKQLNQWEGETIALATQLSGLLDEIFVAGTFSHPAPSSGA